MCEQRERGERETDYRHRQRISWRETERAKAKHRGVKGGGGGERD